MLTVKPVNDPVDCGPGGERWRELVEKGLRGRPFSDLVAEAAEGFPIRPLEAAAKPLASGGRGHLPWTRLQRIDHPDPTRSAELALEALTGGADGLVLVLDTAPGARGFGVAARDLPQVLEKVLIDACAIRLEAGADGVAVAEGLAAETRARRIDPALVSFAFGTDPLSAIAAGGTGLSNWPRTAEAVAGLVSRLTAAGYAGPILAADGRRAHEAGADAASELAFVLAAALVYVRAMNDAGISAASIARAIETVLAADADQFVTMAKFRAARLLLRKLHRATGLPDEAVRIHGETSYRMTTRLDPHSNLIRAGIAAFAAGVGGADSLSVLPYTAPLGLPGAAARRLALDIQSVLVEEAGVARVADPAAGSGSVETLTADLAAEAWRRFQAIEAEGGLIGSLASGAMQQRIAAERVRRMDGVAAQSIAIVGVNIFRAAAPTSVDVDAPCPAPAPAGGREFEPLPSIRASEDLESAAA